MQISSRFVPLPVPTRPAGTRSEGADRVDASRDRAPRQLDPALDVDLRTGSRRTTGAERVRVHRLDESGLVAGPARHALATYLDIARHASGGAASAELVGIDVTV